MRHSEGFFLRKQWMDSLLKLDRIMFSASKGNVLCQRHQKDLGFFQDGLVVFSELERNLYDKLFYGEVVDLRKRVGDGSKRLLYITKILCEWLSKNLLLGDERVLEKKLLQLEEQVFSFLKESKQKADLSLHNQKLVQAVRHAGKYGNVLVEDGMHIDDEWEQRKGFHLDTKLLYGEEGEYQQVLIALALEPLTQVEHVQSLLEEATQFPGFPVFVFCPFIEDEALKTVHMNREHITTIFCKTPASWKHLTLPYFEDLNVYTKATVMNPDEDLPVKKFSKENFGVLKDVIVKKDRVLFFGYEEEEFETRILERVRHLRKKKDSTGSTYERDQYQERIANLSEGMVLYRCGGATETERRKKREEVEKELLLIKASLKGGQIKNEVWENFDFLGVELFFNETYTPYKVWALIFEKAFSLARVFNRLGYSLEKRS